MKYLWRGCLSVLLLWITFAAAAEDNMCKRIVEISQEKSKVPSLAIVVEKSTPLLDFAAKELQNFLQQATGKRIAISKTPPPEGISLILGDCPLARKEGIDVRKLPPEGFYIVRKGNHVYLAGKDAPKGTPVKNAWEQAYKRGTLSAVYDCLERFASVRFYFPGPYGTIVPAAKGSFSLPEKINILERPDMPQRNYTTTHRTKFYPTYPDYTRKDNKPNGDTLTRIRLRFSEYTQPHCHGLNQLEYLRRFGKSHPEYFAMLPDGKRYNEPKMIHTGQLCFSSPLREEIYLDVKAALSGKSAKTRGLSHWRYNSLRGSHICIAPQDWLYWCGCEKCRKIATPGRGAIYSDPAQRQNVSNFMWKMASEFGFRLKKEGVKGYICQSVYPPFNLIPECEIPDNIRIMSCVFGRGGEKADTELIRKWYEKTGKRKMEVWTYSIGKHMAKKILGVIPMYPENIGRFLDDNKEYILGAYYESESDYLLFQYLNYYVFAKKAWDNSVNVRDLLAEHHQVMFGKGAPFMKKFYESLEDKWANHILGTVVNTGLGPACVIPKDYRIWNEIYSPAVMKEYNRLFDKALSAAAGDKGALKRIAFIRKNFFGPLEETVRKYTDSRGILDYWNIHCPGTVYLRPYKGDTAEVATRVSVRKEAGNLIVTFDCEEPRMKDLKALQTQRDHEKIYEDSDVEILLNPSGDRKNYFHFAVNSNGALADYSWTAGKADRSWNSSAKAKVTKGTASWKAEITIPLKDLGKVVKDSFPVNFCRERVLTSGKVVSYHWSPFSNVRGGYHAIENWGKLYLKGTAPAPAVRLDFTEKKLPYCWMSGGKKGGQICKTSDRIFISGGKSLYFKNADGKMMGMAYPCLDSLKAGTKYRLSYFVRTDNMRSSQKTGNTGVYVAVFIQGKQVGSVFPRSMVSGTTQWHRVTGTFKTPPVVRGPKKNFLSIAGFRAGGEAFFDEIIIEEIK